MGNAAAFPEHLAEGNSTAQVHWCTARSPDVSLRGAKRRGNLAVLGRIIGYFRRKRNCLPEIATSACGLAMTNLGAVAILTVARSSLQHCAGPGCPLPYIGRCNSAVPSRDCTPRALPRASRSGRHVGLRPPRNDKSLAFTVLSAVCSGRQRCAGPGCPLPYNDFPIIWKGP